MMDESKTPFMDAHIDLLLHQQNWSDDTPDETRTLVCGNIRGAISRLVDDGVLIPADEIDARVREISSIAEGMKAARSESEDTQRSEASQPTVPDALVRLRGPLSTVGTHPHGGTQGRPLT